MKRTWFLLVVALLSACSGPAGPGPGSTPAGATCDGAAQCGCWQCDCQGIDGPGATQRCSDGHCPSGAEACAAVCAGAGAKVAKATPIDRCPGTP